MKKSTFTRIVSLFAAALLVIGSANITMAFAADDSVVQSFTVGTPEEAGFIVDEYNACAPADARYHDNDAYTTYRFAVPDGMNRAYLSMDIASQWAVMASTDGTNFYLVGRCSCGNVGADASIYESVTLDVSSVVYNNTSGYAYFKFCDAYPENGWGGYIHSTSPVTFSLEASDESSKTQSFTVGTVAEQRMIAAEDGACTHPDGRYHDNTAYTVYRFNTYKGFNKATLTCDIAAQWEIKASKDGVNYVTVGKTDGSSTDGGNIEHVTVDLTSMLAGSNGSIFVKFCDADTSNGWGCFMHNSAPVAITYENMASFSQSFTVGTAAEAGFIVDESGACAPAGGRYHDNDTYTTYRFTVPSGMNRAYLSMDIASQWAVMASTDGTSFYPVGRCSCGNVGADASIYESVTLDVSSVVYNNTSGYAYFKFCDAYPENGWGGYIHSTSPVTFSVCNEDETSKELSFTVGTAAEQRMIAAEDGACTHPDGRYHDNTAYTVYRFNTYKGFNKATLTCDIAAQWEIKASKDGVNYVTVGKTDGSSTDGGNIEHVTVDLSSMLAGSNGSIFVKFCDADTSNGWGCFMHNSAPVKLTYGSMTSYEQSFTVGTAAEAGFIVDESGACAPAGARYHDNDAYTTYRFAVPDGMNRAYLSMDIASQWAVMASTDGTNFYPVGRCSCGNVGTDAMVYESVTLDVSSVVYNNTSGYAYFKFCDAYPENGWGGYIHSTSPVTFSLETSDETSKTQSFTVGTAAEQRMIAAEDGACTHPDGRYHDNTAYTVYRFNTYKGFNKATLTCDIASQWEIKASKDGVNYVTVGKTDGSSTDGGNIEHVTVDLTSMLTGSNGSIFLKFCDADTSNGWGCFMHNSAPVEVVMSKDVEEEESDTLTVSSENVSAEDAPWKSKSGIKAVIIEDTVATVGANSFTEMSELTDVYVLGEPAISAGAFDAGVAVHGWTGSDTEEYCTENSLTFVKLEEFDAIGYQVGAVKKNMFRVAAQMRWAEYYDKAGFDIAAFGNDGNGNSFNKTLSQNVKTVYKSLKGTEDNVEYDAVAAEEDCYLSAIGVTGLPALGEGGRIIFSVTPYVYNLYSSEKISLDTIYLEYTTDGISQYIPSGLILVDGTGEAETVDWTKV